MLHQLMWECCWSLTANRCYVYSSDMTGSSFSATLTPHNLNADTLRHERNTDLATRTEKPTPPRPPAPFILSPPPCRCWMGGPCGRRTRWESYSSCQAPFCRLPLWSESRRSQPSRMNCCCHSTWTDRRWRKRKTHLKRGILVVAKKYKKIQLNMKH